MKFRISLKIFLFIYLSAGVLFCLVFFFFLEKRKQQIVKIFAKTIREDSRGILNEIMASFKDPQDLYCNISFYNDGMPGFQITLDKLSGQSGMKFREPRIRIKNFLAETKSIWPEFYVIIYFYDFYPENQVFLNALLEKNKSKWRFVVEKKKRSECTWWEPR